MPRLAPARHKCPARSCPAAMPRPGPVPVSTPRPGPVPVSTPPARPCPRINAPGQVLSPYQCSGQVLSPVRRVRVPCPPRPCLHSCPARPVPPCLARRPVPVLGSFSSRWLPGPREGRCDLPGRLRRRSGRNLPAITADHGENRNNYDLSRWRAPARARGARPPVPGFPAFSRPRRYLRRNDLATNFPGSGLLSPGKTDKPRIF